MSQFVGIRRRREKEALGVKYEGTEMDGRSARCAIIFASLRHCASLIEWKCDTRGALCGKRHKMETPVTAGEENERHGIGDRRMAKDLKS